MIETDFRHEQAPVPNDIKLSLAAITKGERITRLCPENGEPLWLLKVESSAFSRVFETNRRYLYRGDFTAPPDENSYTGAECYLAENGLSGFAVTSDGWLVSVFSNQEWRGFLKMIKPIAAEKVKKLVCIAGSRYDGGLVGAYEKVFGFRIAAKTEDDTEIMTRYYGADFVNNFIKHYGKPNHIFMVSSYKKGGDYIVRSFCDYFEAEKFINGI